MIPATVVIVNYNGGQAILDCLAALTAQHPERDILIVDNASTDGSSRHIHQSYPAVSILPLRRNVGFARAVNIAACRIEHDGVMITLNPDTLPHPGFVASLMEPLADDAQIGATAGTLVFSSNRSIVASAGIAVHRNGVALDARLGQRLDELPADAYPIFGPSGGAAAYRLSAFREAGGFCASFFMYLEDVDIAWRLRLQGWNSVAVPRAIAAHDYSSSAGEGSPFKRRLLARNRIWTLARTLPEPIWTRDRAAIIAFDLLAAGHGTITLDRASLQGRAAGIAGLPLRLRERTAIHARATVDADTIADWIEPSISPRRLLELRRLTAKLAQDRQR
jgi:GT2 family glycosyltransferase